MPARSTISSLPIDAGSKAIAWSGRTSPDAGATSAKDAKVSFEIAGPGDRIRITVSRANGMTLQQLFDRDLNEVH